MALGHIEPIAGVLRIGGAYGEPYTWAAPIRYLSPTEVELLGVVRAATIPERRRIAAVLRGEGIRFAWFRRLRDGVMRAKTVFDDRQPKETGMAYSNKQALADLNQEIASVVRPKTNARQAVKALLVAAADDMEAGLDAEHANTVKAYKEAKSAAKARRAGINKAVADAFANTE